MNERDYDRDNSIQANIREDRDLDNAWSTYLDDKTSAAADAVIEKDGFKSRATWMRHLIIGALRRRSMI